MGPCTGASLHYSEGGTDETKGTAMYDPEAPTKLSADGLSHGLGAVLMQSSGEESM